MDDTKELSAWLRFLMWSTNHDTSETIARGASIQPAVRFESRGSAAFDTASCRGGMEVLAEMDRGTVS
jgi:hypothetical protein